MNEKVNAAFSKSTNMKPDSICGREWAPAIDRMFMMRI
jgi:hypothetical protein